MDRCQLRNRQGPRTERYCPLKEQVGQRIVVIGSGGKIDPGTVDAWVHGVPMFWSSFRQRMTTPGLPLIIDARAHRVGGVALIAG